MPARFQEQERSLAHMPPFARDALRRARKMSAAARGAGSRSSTEVPAAMSGLGAFFGAGMPGQAGLAAFTTRVTEMSADENAIVEEEVIEERTPEGVKKTVRRTIRRTKRT
jgi:hypothetical protein